MIEYAVKKCESFGFAPSLEKAKALIEEPSELSTVIIIDDEHPIPMHIDDRHKGLFFVTLGKEVDETYEAPTTDESDLDVLRSLEPPYAEHLIEMYKNKKVDSSKSYSTEFCEYLVDLYPRLRDSSFKELIITLLKNERIPVAQLLEQNPIETRTLTRTVVAHTKPFDDIEIITDKSKRGSSSKVYREKDDLKAASMGNSTQLEAFSKDLFTVVKGKRSSGYNYENRLMNHDVLDLLARNGIVCVPKDLNNSSFEQLMRLFSTFDKFSVIFIHPALLSKAILVESPCEQALPEYEVCEGEILAIAFRYMCVHFFGYKSVYDESLKEYDYLF